MRLLVPALVLCLVACREPAARSWEVYRGSELVLSVSDGAGPLVSTAVPPPGSPPARHPFLSATARAPGEEDALRALLDASKSTEDFLERLKSAGYAVKPAVH